MSQKLVGKAFISVALIATVDLPAMAQAPLAPPPQIPYGVSVSTESAKKCGRRIDCGGAEKQLEDGGSHRRYWGLSRVFRTNAGHPDRKRRLGDRESAYGSPVPASDKTLSGQRSRRRRGPSLIAPYRRDSDRWRCSNYRGRQTYRGCRRLGWQRRSGWLGCQSGPRRRQIASKVTPRSPVRQRRDCGRL